MAHTLLYFLALLSLSTAPLWAKLNQMPSEVLGFWRLFFATVFVGLWIIFKKSHKQIAINRQLVWVALSGFFFFLHLWTYKYAAKHTLVANTMILFATNPIWASIGGAFLFKEKLTFRLVFSYFLAFTGIVILVWQNFQLTPENNLGNLIALTSALFYAIYMIFSKKARQNYSNEHYAFFQYGIAGILFAAASMINQQKFIGYPPASWWAVIGLVALPTFLGHFSMTFLVKHMNLGLMTCGKLIEPVVASILAYYFFSESLSQEVYIAFSLTGAAIVILFWPQIKHYLNKARKA